MTRSEKQSIVNWASALTDKELEDEYYKAVMVSLGSAIEEMYERGYDMVDIREQERYEKYLQQRAGVLAELCEQRGIKLWEEPK